MRELVDFVTFSQAMESIASAVGPTPDERIAAFIAAYDAFRGRPNMPTLLAMALSMKEHAIGGKEQAPVPLREEAGGMVSRRGRKGSVLSQNA